MEAASSGLQGGACRSLFSGFSIQHHSTPNLMAAHAPRRFVFVASVTRAVLPLWSSSLIRPQTSDKCRRIALRTSRIHLRSLLEQILLAKTPEGRWWLQQRQDRVPLDQARGAFHRLCRRLELNINPRHDPAPCMKGLSLPISLLKAVVFGKRMICGIA